MRKPSRLNRSPLWLLVLLLAIASNLWAETPWPLPNPAFFLEHYPPPPEAGDPLDRSDLAYTLAVQALVTPETMAEINRLAGFDVFSFSEVLGPAFQAGAFPQTAAFFQRLEDRVDPIKNALKDHFKRTRPYLAHPEQVQRLVPAEAGYSNPSGHATRSWLFALTLAELAPASRRAFFREAALVGQTRVIGGMHYLTDVVLSRALAELMFEQLMQDEAFRTELANLRSAEWSPPPRLP
jgi:acid phosphatase (class A)